MKDVTPERLERHGLDLLLSRDPASAEVAFRGLIERVPDSGSGWAGLRGALEAQGRRMDAQTVGSLAAAAPGATAIMHRILGQRLSGRGLVFDPEEPVRIRPLAETLREVSAADELRSGDNVVLFLDRGGEPVERRPVLELGGAGGPDVAVRFRTAPKFVASIRNAAVFGEGLVLTEAGEFIDEVNAPCGPSKYGARRLGEELAFEADRYRKGRLPVRVFDEPAFLMAGPTDTAFGDWIVNFAPRLALAEAAGLDCRILLRWKPQPQALPILEALGVRRERVIFHEPGEISLFPKLFAPSWPSRDKGAPMAGVFDIYARASAPAPAVRPLIYLTRRGVTARPLLNEPDVCELFADRGFQIVDPGALSFGQVRQLFASPACVAGPFGSAFHNLVFSRGHPLSLVLMPAHLPYHLTETALWQSDCGNRFAYVLGDMPSENDGFRTPWTISLDKVERALDHMLELVGAGGMVGPG